MRPRRHLGKVARRYVRSLLYLFNAQTLAYVLLGCGAVFLCQQWGLSYGLDFSIVASGIAFPLSFAITQAFGRRERALIAMAELKAAAVGLYWQHRDWAQDQGYPDSLGCNSNPWAMEVSGVLLDFFEALGKYIMSTAGYESMAEVRLVQKRDHNMGLFLADTNLAEDAMSLSFVERVAHANHELPGHMHLMACYAALSKVSVMNEYLTFKSKYTRGGEGGLSRTAQYLRYLVAQMEQLRMIKEYRSPTMLRHSCTILTLIGTVFLAPYFNHVGTCDGAAAEWQYCPGAYAASTAYVVISLLLLNVQASAEHPFDRSGLDDVFFELGEEFNDIINVDHRDRPVCDSGACFAPVAASAGAASAPPVARSGKGQ